MFKPRFFNFVLLVLLLACNRSTGPHQTTADAPTSNRNQPDVQKQSQPDIDKKKYKKAGRNRPPAVGGCLILCSTAQKAAKNFIGCLHGDLCSHPGSPGLARTKNAPAYYFINSRKLVVSGKALGNTWQELSVQNKLKDRTQQMENFIEELAKPLRKTATKVPIKTLLEQGLTQEEASASEATFSFTAPGMNFPWRLKFHKRGVEWLIYSLEYRP
ncbi:MAG: hypothetical protein CMH54_11465 [Myxococcales bacterium]|nr:hypothetical protein [Myxococcales bacterium]|tara:strand:- start:925 stop:1569 length:645 start_codon:yes stop_codon:yes gene_type:complete